MTSPTKEECQALIEANHDWEIAVIIDQNGKFRDDSYKHRTFKRAPVTVLGKQYPEIRKEFITRYDVGDFCRSHRDNSWAHEHPGYRAYAVWITPLNDDYEGGELYFGGNHIRQEVGKIIKNSSRIRHKITEVTKGTRYSLVSWVFTRVVENRVRI